MQKLIHRRCLHHMEREAVSRCPGCGRFFCRECVTEHDGRLLCRNCLAGPETGLMSSGLRAWLPWLFTGGAGFLLAWALFYYAGSVLARVPAQFRGAGQ